MRYATPLLTKVTGEAESLRHVSLKQTGPDGYDERWLQRLIDKCPTVLPIDEIEPAFTPAISVCLELPLSSGFLDNLLLTPQGNIVAVECKLWRNAEARREVVAQIIDYAKDIQRLSYSQLEAAVRSARKDPSFRLYDHVMRGVNTTEPSFDEPRFVDAVTRNLRRGRCLLIVAGDGIKEGAESMTEFLQQHAGMHFALGIVQLAIYEVPNSDQRLVVPSIPVRTTNIIRGIVEVGEMGIVISPPREVFRSERSTTLTEDQFLTGLDALRPGISEKLLEFLRCQEDLNVEYEVRKTMVVRMVVGDLKVLPIVINPDGLVDTGYTFGEKELMRTYSDKLALAIPGAVSKETPTTVYVPRRKSDGQPLMIWDFLDYPEGVRAALETLHQSMTARASTEE